MPIGSDLPPVDAIHDRFDLPESYSGWLKHDSGDERIIFEYWRATSNHVSGAFERIMAQPRPMAGEISLATETFDQFGHRVSFQTHASRSIEYIDRVWQSAARKMDAHPGEGAFDEPPTLPTVIGEWELIEDKWDNVENIAVWEWGFGEATLKVVETDIESHYSYTRRPQRIEYSEPDVDPVVIVEDMSRKFAYEIATHILRNLSVPLSRLGDRLDVLQSVKGIGPAKSRQLALLGFTTTTDISRYLSTEEGTANYKHGEAVDKILTSQIRESINADEGEAGGKGGQETDEIDVDALRGVV